MNVSFLNQKKLKTVAFAYLMLVIAILLLSCSYGFTKSNGKMVWSEWNEGEGRILYYLEGADPGTFKVLAKHSYAKDERHVWYMNQPIDSVDAGSFEVMAHNDYGKDKNHVFMHQIIIPGADPETFTLLGYAYARDKSHVFCGTVPVMVHSVNSFEVVLASTGLESTGYVANASGTSHMPLHITGWGGWARDGVAYYYGAHEVEGADYATFAVLNKNYAKDKNKVFYGEETVVEADPATFVVINSIEAKDKNHKFLCGHIDNR